MASDTHRAGGTGIELKLARAVAACGFHVEEQVPFGPRIVDIYVPEIHTAFEADGPYHSARADAERDGLLNAIYGIHVIRFSQRRILDLPIPYLAAEVRKEVEALWPSD